MRPHEDGVRPVSPGQTPVTAPGTSTKKPKAFAHFSTETPFANAAGSPGTAPRFPIRTSEAAAWALFTLVVGVILIGACVVLTLGWPA